eukprot:g13961.t1
MRGHDFDLASHSEDEEEEEEEDDNQNDPVSERSDDLHQRRDDSDDDDGNTTGGLSTDFSSDSNAAIAGDGQQQQPPPPPSQGGGQPQQAVQQQPPPLPPQGGGQPPLGRRPAAAAPSSSAGSKIAEALKLVGMGSRDLEGDRQVWVEGQPARLPQRDSSNHIRILFLHRMLPPGMAVTRTLTQKEPVEVYDTNTSRKLTIPSDCYTATDCLRLLVAEASRGTATRRIAMQALNSISLLQGESWASALDRLALIYRAATVTPDRPALSEEDYFWQVITTETLQDRCDRAILLCCPAPADTTIFRAALLQHHRQHTNTLHRHPADMHALGSRPGFGSNGQDTFSLQMQQMRTVHALNDFHEDSAGECYEADDPDLAAFNGAAVAAATPSDDTTDGHRRARGDTPYGRRRDITSPSGHRENLTDARRRGNVGNDRSRFHNRAPQPRSRLTQSNSAVPAGATSGGSRKREAPRDAPGTTDERRDHRPRDTEERKPSTTPRNRRKAQLPTDAPQPGTSSSADISDYISTQRVCFSHAHGETCQQIIKRGRCPYSHSEVPIPFNSSPRARDTAAAMGDENQLFYESNKTELALRLAALTAATEDAPLQDEPAIEQGTSDAGSHQSYVKAFLWNRRKRKCGFSATVSVDTGAGGGNYASVKFIHAVQRHVFSGKNIVSKRGRGFLHAANPAKDAVPPMSITGTALLPLIFPPVDRVFTARPWEVLQIDIQDMKVKSEKGNQYLLVVVDRASKFLAAFPLPNKDALSVSRKLLGLLLTFGLPLSIRADMGSENTAQVMQHLCSWLKVSLDYGPVNHPRAQGAVERMGGWLQEALSLLCKAWPKRWDDYVPVATWIHRVTPDPALPGGVSPYQILFGRPPRSHIDLLAQPLDAASFGQGLDRTVEEQHHMTQEILAKRQETLTRQRERHNARLARESPGANAQAGDMVLVRETPVSLYRDSLHPKLAHEHFTGPWKVVNVLLSRLCFTVQLNGRRIRQRRVAAGDVKPFHRRPDHLQHDFEDEYSHLVWSSDLGLQSTSVVAVPLYTLTSRRVSHNATGTGAWTWEYRGRYQDGAQSDWITEDEARESFSPLQLDVFHALWELHHPNVAPRPPGEPTRGEREVESRERALEIFPRGTEVGRIFTDAEGRSKTFKATVYDYCDPYWRVEYPDGDWEELTRREVAEGIGVAAQPPSSA